MTYNIRNANGMDNICNFQRVANVIYNACPAPHPTETIDYIVVLKQNAERYTVISSGVLDEPMASDHRPLIVDLSISK